MNTRFRCISVRRRIVSLLAPNGNVINMGRIDKILEIIDDGLASVDEIAVRDLPRRCARCRRKTMVDEAGVCAVCAAVTQRAIA